MIKELPAPIVWQVEEQDVLTTARYKAMLGISFADSIVAAAAFPQNAVLVHKGPELEALAKVIRIRSLLR